MSDTFTRDCKVCGNEFDSIFALDQGVCSECSERKGQMTNFKNIVLILKDDLEDLIKWSVNNDDKFNEEITQLQNIIKKLEVK